MEQTRPTVEPRRGEIYLVRLDPTQGAEIKKTRPALILQNDPANRRSPLTIAAPLSTKFEEGRTYPTEVLVRAPEGGLQSDSVVQLNQIRSLDKSRLINRLGVVNPDTMHQVERALLFAVDLRDLALLHGFLKQSGLTVADLLKGL